jgi:hypothetical protein
MTTLVGDHVGGSGTGRQLGKPLETFGVVHAQRVFPDVDQADQIADGGNSGWLRDVGERVHDLIAADGDNAVAEFVGDEHGAIGGRGRVVRCLARLHRGGDLATGQRHPDELA